VGAGEGGGEGGTTVEPPPGAVLDWLGDGSPLRLGADVADWDGEADAPVADGVALVVGVTVRRVVSGRTWDCGVVRTVVS
jgi:hypothetical protein